MRTSRSPHKLRALHGTSLAAMVLVAGPSLAQTGDRGSMGPEPAAEEAGVLLDEIVVTGTSIRGVPPVGSNLISVSRAEIEAVGAANTPDLLASVPQLNSFNTAPTANGGGFGSFAPGMRGLPSNATLPLMNGHRLVAAAANETNPDFPLIPNLAIERVEVVADGASSIYGSDAVAGVINFITRRNVSGAEISANYGVGEGYHSANIGALIGRRWGEGSFLAAYQYTTNDDIVGRDRDYRVLDFRPYGGIDTRAVNCPSPNVLFDSSGFAINHAAPDLRPNTQNFCDNGAGASLYPSSEIHSAFLSARQEIGGWATAWGELLYSDRHDEIRAALPVQAAVIGAANPFFRPPAGGTATTSYVLFRPDTLVGADHFLNTDDKRVGNSSVGVDFHLPGDFELSMYGTFDWAENVAFIPSINAAALAAAAAGTTPATALDPYGTGTSPAVASAILESSTSVTINQRTDLGALRLNGPVADLPAGEAKIALGAEFRRETFEQKGFVGATPVPEELERDITSVYGEVFVPLIGAANAKPLVRSLSLSLSGRYDEYSDFGSTTNPKVGVNWEPIEGVGLRASYGQSFRAPGVRQVGATVGAYYLNAASAAVSANDPTRGLAQVDTVYLLGGNRNLEPEEAETYSFGIDFNPTLLPDLRASLTYYNIEYTNVIGTPPTALVFTDPTFASIVYRNPTQAELSGLLSLAVPVNLPTPLPAIGNLLDLRLNNFGIRNTDGLDFFVNYRWQTSFGAVYAELSGNHVLGFDTQLSPGAPVSDSLKLGVPRLSARASLGANTGAFNFTGFVNYRDGVTNNFTTPTGVSSYKADPYMTVDLRATWTLPDEGWSRGSVLSLQVNDLFDQDPPFFPATDGIGGAYNPIGRFVALNLRKSF
ncbi:TonB-dependent receptor plug domain-containing protein [Phenylobacterium sp.]|uniref:TonB-dependent receptor plug domain-containing protein n=1 Tax=Phenylobacterium sp. TaxID=1871053 RepID=UPI0035C86EEA